MPISVAPLFKHFFLKFKTSTVSVWSLRRWCPTDLFFFFVMTPGGRHWLPRKCGQFQLGTNWRPTRWARFGSRGQRWQGEGSCAKQRVFRRCGGVVIVQFRRQWLWGWPGSWFAAGGHRRWWRRWESRLRQGRELCLGCSSLRSAGYPCIGNQSWTSPRDHHERELWVEETPAAGRKVRDSSRTYLWAHKKSCWPRKTLDDSGLIGIL